MRKTFFARFSLPILMAFCFLAPLLIQGAQRTVRSNSNKVTDWLPKSFKETTELRWFRQHFTADQFVVVSWDGCTLGDNPNRPGAKPDDPRIEKLAKFLIPKSKYRSLPGYEHAKFFQSVITARHVLDTLSNGPSQVPYDEAVKRLTGTLIGGDGRQTSVVVMLSDESIKNFRAVVGRSVPSGPMPWQRKPGVLIQALQRCGIDPDTVRLGGPPVENVAIDEEGDRTLARLALLSGAFGLGLAWWSLRSVSMTLIVFACGILSAAAGLATVSWSGQTSDAIMMSMPSMMYVLAISGAVHLINYYRDAVHETGLDGAPERALSHGWKPALLCNVTTGVGLASLCTADLAPIRKFGIYSAVAVAVMLVILFLFLPAALQFWPIKAARRKRSHDEHPDGQTALGQGTIWNEQKWSRFGGAIIRHHWAVSIACFAFIGVISLGLLRVHTNIDLLKLFDDSVRVRQDYAWFERHIGRLVPLEVVVKIPADKQRTATQNVDAAGAAEKLSFLERLELVAQIQQAINKQLGPDGRNLVGPSLSPVTFAPPLPDDTHDSWALARRNVTNVKLEESQKALQKSGYLRTEDKDGTELWRISLRAAAFEDLDYGQFVHSVRAVVEPVFAAQRMREAVLARIASERPRGVAGASVCLWQRRALPPPTADAPDLSAAASQQQMVTTSAQELLAKARLRLTAANIDLATLTDQQRDSTLKHFKAFDCVVALGTTCSADIKELEHAGVCVVDARSMLKPINDEPVLNPTGPSTVSAVYTGVVPIVYKAQRALLDNLIQSSVWSFATITPLLWLVCRSVWAGSVVMIPNILPVLFVFGGMGWLGVPIDIGSMMSASIALGVAVDDTIHFLTWYREDLNRLGDRKQAIIAAYGRCGPPSLQAALISGLSLSVFITSTFTPTQRLGWLMMSILIAGVVAELIMMPALLAGPLGRVFKPKTAPRKPTPIPAPHMLQTGVPTARVRH